MAPNSLRRATLFGGCVPFLIPGRSPLQGKLSHKKQCLYAPLMVWFVRGAAGQCFPPLPLTRDFLVCRKGWGLCLAAPCTLFRDWQWTGEGCFWPILHTKGLQAGEGAWNISPPLHSPQELGGVKLLMLPMPSQVGITLVR